MKFFLSSLICFPFCPQSATWILAWSPHLGEDWTGIYRHEKQSHCPPWTGRISASSVLGLSLHNRVSSSRKDEFISKVWRRHFGAQALCLPLRSVSQPRSLSPSLFLCLFSISSPPSPVYPCLTPPLSPSYRLRKTVQAITHLQSTKCLLPLTLNWSRPLYILRWSLFLGDV